MHRFRHDTGERAVIVGAGHNGLTAAALLARAGWDVDVFERAGVVGGSATSSAVLGEGTVVDHGAAAHPFGIASPVFKDLGLANFGLRWAHSRYPLAHPLANQPAAVLHRCLPETAAELGRDARRWTRLHEPVVSRIDDHLANFLGPLLRLPPHPAAMARFGVPGLLPAQAMFRTTAARALFAGSAGHAIVPPSHPMTVAFGTVFSALGMTRGWPVAVGGTQAISDALAAAARSYGARIHLNAEVSDLRELPAHDAAILNLTPRQVLALDGIELPRPTHRRLGRWRYGTAAYKVDYLLSEPAPWADRRVREATTVHVGGTAEEIDAAEKQVLAGRLPESPFVLVCQQQVADPSRARSGQHVLWAYTHVPPGYVEHVPGEVTRRIEAQIERFCPGFGEVIVDKRCHSPHDLEAWNPNLIGGDIAGGSMLGAGALLRPGATLRPYQVAPRVFMASGATPPGAGVHGMAGAWAARAAMRA